MYEIQDGRYQPYPIYNFEPLDFEKHVECHFLDVFDVINSLFVLDRYFHLLLPISSNMVNIGQNWGRPYA